MLQQTLLPVGEDDCKISSACNYAHVRLTACNSAQFSDLALQTNNVESIVVLVGFAWQREGETKAEVKREE
jgi:hypothetical protein